MAENCEESVECRREAMLCSRPAVLMLLARELADCWSGGGKRTGVFAAERDLAAPKTFLVFAFERSLLPHVCGFGKGIFGFRTGVLGVVSRLASNVGIRR